MSDWWYGFWVGFGATFGFLFLANLFFRAGQQDGRG